MKRILAITLIIVMLIPLCLTAKADTVAVKPFYAVNWSGNDREQFPNMAGMPSVYIYPSTGIDPYLYYRGIETKNSSMTELIAKVRNDMKNLPEGMRYMQFLHPGRVFSGYGKDIIDLDAGVEVLKGLITEFMQQYKKRGGLLDGVIMDLEYEAVTYSSIYSYGYKNNANVYKDIAENSMYRTKIRPKLAERGFQFWPNPSGEKSELWSICVDSGSAYDESRKIWDAVMREYLAQCLNEAIYKPMKASYPDAHMSDYLTTDYYGWNKEQDKNGYGAYLGGNTIKAGDTSNLNTYFVQPGIYFYTNGSSRVYKNPFGYNEAVYDDDSYGMFLWDINRFKNMYDSTDTGRVNFWISEYDSKHDQYTNRESSTCNTPYYSETFFHAGLLNPDVFLLYLPREERKDLTDEEFNKRYQVVSDCLNELTDKVGFADRKPILVPANWNDGFILSGMYAGGRNVWRITPDTTDGMTLANFKVKDKAPTFKINGKTVIFPQGRILQTGDVAILGTCGYWVETPADVTPVILSDADRFSANPSYMENFERYNTNTQFSASTVKEKNAWEISGSAATVIAQSGNKVLSVTGTTNITNVKLPANITAGDNYAKLQAWEVSFTLPAALSGGTVSLLTNGADTGFKISGSALYYDKNGTATQFDGLTLSAGTKYTLRREVNFNNTTCTYLVFANGQQVAKAENIKMARVTLPIEQIGFFTNNLGGQKIYLDDYKLYPMGFTADFEVYNAATGIKLADMTKAADTDVAYRLSWLNNSGIAKKATVVAQYFKNGAQNSSVTVGEFVMAPGDDGVETAIVENKDGMTVKLVLQTADTTLPATPNYDNGNFGWVIDTGADIPDETVGETQDPTQTPEESTDGTPEESTDDVPGESTDSAVDNTDGTSENTATTPPDTTKPADKQDGGNWIIFAVIGAVLAGGAVAAGIWLMQKKKQENAEATSEPADEE